MIESLDPAELASRSGFKPLRPGVDILVLYESPETGASAAVLRYAPGASVPAHEHPGYEHIVVLSGSQTDHRGTHTAGTLVVNGPGTSHSIRSDDGCLVLAIWEKPVRFIE